MNKINYQVGMRVHSVEYIPQPLSQRWKDDVPAGIMGQIDEIVNEEYVYVNFGGKYGILGVNTSKLGIKD